MSNTKTATISSGLVPASATLKVLLLGTLAGKSEVYRDVILENTGNLNVKVAAMEKNAGAPSTADYINIAPGDVQIFDRVIASYFYISLDEPVPADEPDLPDYYTLKFTGTPDSDG